MTTLAPIGMGVLMACLIPEDGDPGCGSCDLAAPDLGDIRAICRLLDETTRELGRLVEANGDPGKPGLPKLRMVGSQIVRVPHSALYHDLLRPSFAAAMRLGYRGTYERWGELVREGCDRPDLSGAA